MASDDPVVPATIESVWLVWLRVWIETDDGRRFVPRLIGVCSSVNTALEMMVSGGDSTFVEQVAMNTVIS